MKYILGIDVGTSLIKAAIYTIEGLEVCLSYCKTTIYSPSKGFYEQDMNEVWNALCECIVTVN